MGFKKNIQNIVDCAIDFRKSNSFVIKTEELYFNDHTIKVEKIYLDSGKVIIKKYNSTGYIISKYEYTSEGICDGYCVTYYDNGNTKAIYEYCNGALNGNIKTFYKSGILKSSELYEHGVKEGTTYTFFENGYMAGSQIYVKGEKIADQKYSKKDEITPEHDENATNQEEI